MVKASALRVAGLGFWFLLSLGFSWSSHTIISIISSHWGGCRGTTDVLMIFLQPSLSSASLRVLARGSSVHSLMLSCQHFFGLPRLLLPGTVRHTSDLKIGTLVVTLPGRVSAGTGWPGVSILWVRWKVWSATSISVWQHAQLSEQIYPWDTLACCLDVQQSTNNLPLSFISLHWYCPSTAECSPPSMP